MRPAEHLVIVGGGPAALAAARGYRAAGGEGRVTLVTDDDRAPYNRPALTKEYLRGELEPADLFLEQDGWYGENRVEVVHAAAEALDPDERTVTLAGDRPPLRYDACVLATGAEPRRLPVPGAEDDRILLMRTARDSERLAQLARPGVAVTVIGTGFIGCEAAASLAARGAQVTLLGLEPCPQAERLGVEVGERLRDWLAEAGVSLRLGASVERIEREGERFTVHQAGGQSTGTGLLVMASGVRPRDQLAVGAGLRLGSGARAVATDAALRTTGDRILAAGDVCEAQHPVAGRPLRVEHWGDALAQGEVAGRRLAGESARWEDVPGFWSMIGARTLKYAAWGDGFDAVRLEEHGEGAFAAWYALEGRIVGVLTHERDDDYERGRDLIANGAPLR